MINKLVTLNLISLGVGSSYAKNLLSLDINRMSKEEVELQTKNTSYFKALASRQYSIPMTTGLIPQSWLYYGTFYVGSTPDRVNLLFTTLTDWTIIASSDCRECISKPYNYTASETCLREPGQVLHPNMTTLEIDNRKLQGFAARDTICIDKLKEKCVEKFEFYTVT